MRVIARGSGHAGKTAHRVLARSVPPTAVRAVCRRVPIGRRACRRVRTERRTSIARRAWSAPRAGRSGRRIVRRFRICRVAASAVLRAVDACAVSRRAAKLG